MSSESQLSQRLTPSFSDREVYEAVADYFAPSRFDLDSFLQRLARKDEMTSRDAARHWAALAGGNQTHVNLYIHIPFCRHHCAYCGYFTVTPEGATVVRDYLESLAAEARFFSDALGGVKIRNLFVGGGTPTFLNNEQMKYFIDNVLTAFRYHKDGQRTIECDPFTLTAEKIKLFKGSVLKRMSMGVESLDVRVLDALGRTQRGGATGTSAVRLMKESGFAHDLNCDLILGLVQDTPESFLESFRGLLKEGVAKIIVYALKPIPSYLEKFYGGDLEEFSRFYKRMADAVEGPMKDIGEEFGYVCHKNSDVVWYFIERGDTRGSALHRYEDDSSFLPLSVMGLGSSARSRVLGRTRYAQVHRLLDRFDPDEPIFLGQTLDRRNEMVRTILTSLRNKREVSLARFKANFGCDLREEYRCTIDSLGKDGLLEVTDGVVRVSSADPRDALLVGMNFVGRPEVEATFSDILAGRPMRADGSGPSVLEAGAIPPVPDSGGPRALVIHLDGGSPQREELRREIQAAYEEGCRSLSILGGDPSSFPFVLDGTRFARETGYARISLCLDGTGWADEAYLGKLRAAGVNKTSVVLHGHTDEGEEAVTGRRGEFVEKMRGLKLLMGMEGESPALHGAVCRASLPRLEGYILHFRAMGIKRFRFHFASPQFGLRLKEPVVPSYQETLAVVRRLMLLNEATWRLDLSFGGIPPCVLRFGGGKVLSQGLWQRLENRYLSIPEGYSDRNAVHAAAPARFKKQLFSSCQPCTFLGRCEGVWDFYTSIYGTKDLEPVRFS